MQKVAITMEIVTPMLSSGDNQKKAEFRITELKSLMRNTFRELYDFKNEKDMKDKEDDLFGSMSKKSPICFKVDKIERKGELKELMLPHKIKEKEKANTSCLGYNSEVFLHMMTKNKADIELYVILLIQASIVGAMGKRSRKGFGSFQITHIEGLENSEEYNNLVKKAPRVILEECEEMLNVNHQEYKIRKSNSKENTNCEELQFINNSNINFPYITKVRFVKTPFDKEDKKEKIYRDIILAISKLTHNRLSSDNPNKDFIKDIQNKENINKNILGNYRNHPDHPNKYPKLNRFASPICVSFYESINDRYMVIKELNYEYIFPALRKSKPKEKVDNIAYVDEYVRRLIEIGKGHRG